MNGHFDVDSIAEYRAGLITGRHRRKIAAHLATCAQCASVGDRVAEVSILLAAVPPPALPDFVAARLQAALDAEPAISSEQTVVTPAGPRFRLPRLIPLRMLAPVAALAVLAAGGFGLSHLAGGSSASQASAGSAAAGSAASAVPSARSVPFGKSRLNELPTMGIEGTLKVAASGIDLQAATLGRQLEELFQTRSQLRVTPASTAVKACVRTVAASSPVELVATADYHGSPATVVIVSVGTGYQGIVAGPDCSATDSDIIARAALSSGISTP